MDDVEFTKEDLIKLRTMIAPGSVLEDTLEEIDYDPIQFKAFMKLLPSQYKILYDTPLEELPMMLEIINIKGLINFRFSVGK